TVLTAPIFSASSSSSSRKGMIACLCGIVTFQPLVPNSLNDSTACCRCSGFTCTGIYVASTFASSYHALCISGDFECAIGSPITANHFFIDNSLFPTTVHSLQNIDCVPLNQ